jgi:hypothetical protein
VDVGENVIRELQLKRLKRSRDPIPSESYDECLGEMRTKVREQHEAMRSLTKEALADSENREDKLIAARGYDYLEQLIFLIEDEVILRLQDYLPVCPLTLSRKRCLVVIVESIAEALSARKREGTTDLPWEFLNWRAWESDTDPLVGSYIQYVVMVVRRGKPDADDLINMIETSRSSDGSLSATYVAWCNSFLDHIEVNATILKYHRFYGYHFKDVTEFSEEFLKQVDFEPRNKDWPLTHVFIDDDQEDKVRMVHYRGHCPVGLSVLSEDVLSKMGWHRGTDRRHWRYRHSNFPTLHIFKEQMGGKVVGLWMPEKDIDCEEEFEASLEKQREGFRG